MSGAHFENGYDLKGLAQILDVVMQHQSLFTLPPSPSRHPLLQITLPTEKQSAESAALVRTILAWVASYYANAPDARSADVIELRAGGEVSGVNVRVASAALPSTAVPLRGFVVDASGAPVQGNYGISIASWPTPTPTTLASVRPLTTLVAPPNPWQSAPGAQVVLHG